MVEQNLNKVEQIGEQKSAKKNKESTNEKMKVEQIENKIEQIGEQIRQVKKLSEWGMSLAQVAVQMGISQDVAYKLLNFSKK